MAAADAPGLIPWLWRGYLRRFLPLILIALLLMSIEGAMLGLLSFMIEPMFDDVFVAGNRGAIAWVAGGIFLIFMARALSGFGHRVIMARVGQRVSAALQQDLVGHMLTLDNLWFQKTPPGNLIERVRGDTLVASTIWSSVLAAGGRDLVSLIALFTVALLNDWVWTLIAIAGVPLLMAPIMGLQRLVRKATRRARAQAADISTRLDEMFHGVTTIKLNRLEAHESQRFEATMEKFLHKQFRSDTGRAGIPAMMDIIAAIGFLGVLYYGGLQIIDGEKTVGEFMSFFTAMALVFQPLRKLGNVTGAWQAARASLERLHAVFEERPTILSPAAPKAPPLPADQADVALRDVRLAYDDTPVLNGLTLTAKAGQMTALVGPSGAGKSTVFNVITRLADPQSGQITLGGTTVSDMDLTRLRAQFSVVTQDSLLFDDSLRDNILLGREGVTDAQLNAVLEAAHITDFLPSLPDGLDSPAGPRGSNLSGGQRQRVAIARALLRDAPILLLDEATSALDAKSEKVVQAALDRLCQGRTTIVIAHRLSTVRHADKIVVMDKGRVAEEGTHASLLDKGGLYSGLYQMQFASEG